MNWTRRYARLTHWIAALAVLLGALAPALSHAFAPSQGGTWVEVCTAQGSRWVQAESGSTEGTPTALHALEHCPYCSLHTPTLGLPPAPVTEPLASNLGEAVPLAFLFAPRTLHAWVSAQPRAPPLFS